MRRHAKAPSAGSTSGIGSSRGLFGRAFANRGTSSDLDGSGALSSASAKLPRVSFFATVAASVGLLVAAPSVLADGNVNVTVTGSGAVTSTSQAFSFGFVRPEPVTVTPGEINCDQTGGPVCSANYVGPEFTDFPGFFARDIRVTLTAAAATNMIFAGWQQSGATSVQQGCTTPPGNPATCVVDLNGTSNPTSAVIATFVPPPEPPIVFTDVISAGAAAHVATLEGRVNPNSADFSVSDCRFVYGTSTSYGKSVPCSQTPLGSGTTELPVSATTGYLQPNTTYHFRLRASNLGGTGQGKDRIFTTGPAPPNDCPNAGIRAAQGVEVLLLPDCMALEQVSPPKKGNRAVWAPHAVSADAQRIAFLSSTALGPCPISSPVGGSRYIATRGETAWTPACTQPTTPVSKSLGLSLSGGGSDSFSPDLARWIHSDRIESSGGAVYMQRQIDGLLSPLAPPLLKLAGTGSGASRFRGASADHSSVYFSPVPSDGVSGSLKDISYLPGDPTPAGTGEDANLYVAERDAAGQPSLALVARDRHGEVWGGNCGARLGGMEAITGQNLNLQNGDGRNKGAISADGSRVYFSTRPDQPPTGNCTETNKKRIMVREETPAGSEIEELIPSDECDRVADPGPPAVQVCSIHDGDDVYQGASVDQTKVYFNTTRQLADTDVDGGATGTGDLSAATGSGDVNRVTGAGTRSTLAAGTANRAGGSDVLTGLVTSTGAFSVGESISGTGIPVGTTIAALDTGAGTLTMSAPATSTSTGSFAITSGSRTLTGVTGGPFAVGMAITGTGLPAATAITAVDTGAGTVTLSRGVTSAGTSTNLAAGAISNVSASSGAFAVGQTISGAGVPNNATIVAIDAGVLRLSAVPTTAGTAVPLSAASRTIANVSTSSGVFEVGQTIAATGLPAGTTITAVNLGAGTVTISQSPTAAASGTVIAAGNPSCSNETAISGCDLYLYDSTRPAGERLIQVSAGEFVPGPNPGDPPIHEVGKGARVRNSITAISADGSHAYFVAQAVLTEDPNPEGKVAKSGQNNLYVYSAVDGDIGFVGILDSADGGSFPNLWLFGGQGNWENDAYAVPIAGKDEQGDGVGGDGHVLLFRSKAPLTAEDGDAFRDIFRYDAEADTLEGVSTEGDGPWDVGKDGVGRSSSLGTDYDVRGRWASEDGETVVFTTNEGLAAGDVNGVEDAYMWRRGQIFRLPGSARITSQSPANAPVVSRDGSTVAYHGSEQVLASDGDSVLDVYVARVNGGFPLKAAESVCAGEACQGPPATLAPGGSATGSFSGAGNVTEPRNCAALARQARRLSSRAVRLHRSARRLRGGGKSEQMSRKSRQLKKRARGLARGAAACRDANRRAAR